MRLLSRVWRAFLSIWVEDLDDGKPMISLIMFWPERFDRPFYLLNVQDEVGVLSCEAVAFDQAAKERYELLTGMELEVQVAYTEGKPAAVMTCTIGEPIGDDRVSFTLSDPR